MRNRRIVRTRVPLIILTRTEGEQHTQGEGRPAAWVNSLGVVAIVGMLHRLIIDVDDNFDPWQMRCNGSVELCLNLGDGADQAARLCWVGMTSMPSANLTPAMIFPQLICAFQSTPGFRGCIDQLEHHQSG